MRIRRHGRAILLLLSGCTVGPRYHPPVVALSPAFSNGPMVSSPDDAEWWKAFDDAELTSLISRAIAQGPDVQEAFSRIEQARQQEWIERGSHGPRINGSAQGGTTRLSGNALPAALSDLVSANPNQPSSGSGLGLPGETFTTYQLGFDASWELDLFGGQRRANEAARARTDAALWSARDAEVMLTAEVANTYEQYRGLQRRLALADEGLATQRETLDFIAVRTRHGLADDREQRQQERAIAQSTAQRENLAADIEIRLHTLATLLGLQPTALMAELSGGPSDVPAQIEVPPGLPSELLERRPDLRRAERQLAAANADIGVATADLYPKFSLTGSLQLASRSLSSLFESNSVQDNASGRVSLPLFDRSRLHATVDLRQMQADEALMTYTQSVLTALRDVEDGLTRLAADRRQLDQQRIATAAAQDEMDSARVRFRHGLIAAVDMLSAQQTWQSARDSESQAEDMTTQDVIALYNALGGGWDDRRASIEAEQASGHGS